MKLLLADDDDSLRELMVFALESQLGATILEAHSATQAMPLIQANPDIQCIISDYSMPNGNGGELFLQLHADSKLSKIPFVLISSQKPEEFPEFKGKKTAGFLLKPFQLSLLVNQVRTLAVKSKKLEPLSEFCRIKASTLVRLGFTHCDLYIKLSDEKYVRVLKKEDPFLAEDQAKYSQKSTDSLYLKREDSQHFLKSFTKQLQDLMDSKSPLTEETAFEIPKRVHEVVHSVTHTLGFTTEAQELTRSCIALTVKTITKSPQLSQWLKKLLVNKEEYISSHSILQAYLSCGISSLMGWTSETTFYKLSLASFLHDITLTNHELARFRSVGELLILQNRFSSAEIAAFQSHPEDAAKIIRGISEIPPDVDTIVAQHHERPDGSGFPRGIQERDIHPLAFVFIVAHDMTSYITENGANWQVTDFLREASRNFRSGLGKKIVEEMERRAETN